MELAYASLQQLCAPLVDSLATLPAPQRQALETVFGLSSGAAPDRFLVGLGVLSLLSEAAEGRALLCVIDDAQWLDHASALTLAFVARRLLAEPIGIVFAAREPSEDLQHVADLEVRGVEQRRCPRAAGLGGRVQPGRAGPRPDHRGDAREPARLAGAAARADGAAAGRRLRPGRCADSLRANRGELRPTTRSALGRRAATVAARGGGAGRRSAAAAACVRADRDRGLGGRRGNGRAPGDRRSRDLPASAGALRRLPHRGRPGTSSGPPGIGGGDRTRDRPRPPCVASRYGRDGP